MERSRSRGHMKWGRWREIDREGQMERMGAVGEDGEGQIKWGR